MSFLIDTNVISELRKPAARRNPGVVAWAAQIDPSEVYISAVTISELSEWVARTARRDATQGAILDGWFQTQVLNTYGDRILPVDTAVAARAGTLHVPDRRDYRDAFIAATALEHDLTVVTRNVTDFAPTGAQVLNPFT
ncbi:MAG: type II toxin-antitoxin system VapC family toxin [Bifidobacteriaceae bacterium]|jgi:predicted nucleic acid-binding protein|nr:type II toxin-antitoxin system VapC family toxin [Bifidobacteriaceae bacterium]